MKSKNGKGISAMRMARKDGTEEGVFANDEEAEERVLAYEEGPKRRCWPMGSISQRG